MDELSKQLEEENKKYSDVQSKIDKLCEDNSNLFKGTDCLDDEVARLREEQHQLKDSVQPSLIPLKDWNRSLNEQILMEQESLNQLLQENKKTGQALGPKSAAQPAEPAKGGKGGKQPETASS